MTKIKSIKLHWGKNHRYFCFFTPTILKQKVASVGVVHFFFNFLHFYIDKSYYKEGLKNEFMNRQSKYLKTKNFGWHEFSFDKNLNLIYYFPFIEIVYQYERHIEKDYFKIGFGFWH